MIDDRAARLAAAAEGALCSGGDEADARAAALRGAFDVPFGGSGVNPGDVPRWREIGKSRRLFDCRPSISPLLRFQVVTKSPARWK